MCFLPNGTERMAGYRPSIWPYVPINTGDDHSTCCAQTDRPRSDGLCETSLPDTTKIYRESCTDQSWQSPKCIKLCAGFSNDTNPSPTQGRQEDNDEIVTPCGDGSYCCGPSGAGTPGSICCNEGLGVFVKDGTTQKADPSATSSSPYHSQPSLTVTTTPSANVDLSTNVTSNTVPVAPSSTPTAPHTSKLNTGAIAGGVIGGLAGLALILAAIWFLVYKKKNTNKTKGYEMAQPGAYPFLTAETRLPQEVQGSFAEDYERRELQAGEVSKAAGRPELDTI